MTLCKVGMQPRLLDENVHKTHVPTREPKMSGPDISDQQLCATQRAIRRPPWPRTPGFPADLGTTGSSLPQASTFGTQAEPRCASVSHPVKVVERMARVSVNNAIGLRAVTLSGFPRGLALWPISIVCLHNHLHYLARVLFPGGSSLAAGSPLHQMFPCPCTIP